MRAAVLHGARDLRVEEVPDPPLPGVGEVTLAVRRCGICGTDAHEYAHGGPMTPLTAAHPWSRHRGPTIIGHEFLGTVAATGPGVPFREGDRVVAGAGQWCGECAACRAGRTNLCERYFTYGLSTHGGMAEYVTVPARMCVTVPESCPDDDAVLAQPVAIAMHALDRAQAAAGTEVLVIGAGGIGALLVAAAADRGLTVHVADLDSERLATAARLGAATTQLNRPDDAAPPFDGIPTVFETSGSAAGLRLALTVAARGGRVVAVGLPSTPVPIDSRHAVVSEIDIVTSSAHVCPRDLPLAVDLLARRPLSKEIVAAVVPLDRLAEDGLEPMAAGVTTGKVVAAISSPSRKVER